MSPSLIPAACCESTSPNQAAMLYMIPSFSAAAPDETFVSHQILVDGQIKVPELPDLPMEGANWTTHWLNNARVDKDGNVLGTLIMNPNLPGFSDQLLAVKLSTEEAAKAIPKMEVITNTGRAEGLPGSLFFIGQTPMAAGWKMASGAPVSEPIFYGQTATPMRYMFTVGTMDAWQDAEFTEIPYPWASGGLGHFYESTRTFSTPPAPNVNTTYQYTHTTMTKVALESANSNWAEAYVIKTYWDTEERTYDYRGYLDTINSATYRRAIGLMVISCTNGVWSANMVGGWHKDEVYGSASYQDWPTISVQGGKIFNDGTVFMLAEWPEWTAVSNGWDTCSMHFYTLYGSGSSWSLSRQPEIHSNDLTSPLWWGNSVYYGGIFSEGPDLSSSGGENYKICRYWHIAGYGGYQVKRFNPTDGLWYTITQPGIEFNQAIVQDSHCIQEGYVIGGGVATQGWCKWLSSGVPIFVWMDFTNVWDTDAAAYDAKLHLKIANSDSLLGNIDYHHSPCGSTGWACYDFPLVYYPKVVWDA